MVTFSHWVTLMLYDQFEGYRRVGGVLLYQRRNIDGLLLRKGKLQQVIQLH